MTTTTPSRSATTAAADDLRAAHDTSHEGRPIDGHGLTDRDPHAGPTLDLAALGWSAGWASRLAMATTGTDGLVPGRVVSAGGAMLAVTSGGPVQVTLQRRQRRETDDLPAVGDWLALEPVSDDPPTAALRAILPRSGVFARLRPSDQRPQVVAANLDLAFLVSGLDHDLNLRRLERYLVLAADGSVRPIVVLNKADIADRLDATVGEVQRIAAGTRVIVSSATEGTGVDELRAVLRPGTTGCLLGSSGVGKSSLLNALLGHPAQAVRALREDDSRGRHTTTRRQLFMVPDAGLLIDTPGMRTVGLLADITGLSAAFGDIEALALRCRFRDCCHGGEPGCAVRAVVAEGRLPPERLTSHERLAAERRRVELQSDARARRASERRLGRLYRDASRQARGRLS